MLEHWQGCCCFNNNHDDDNIDVDDVFAILFVNVQVVYMPYKQL